VSRQDTPDTCAFLEGWISQNIYSGQGCEGEVIRQDIYITGKCLAYVDSTGATSSSDGTSYGSVMFICGYADRNWAFRTTFKDSQCIDNNPAEYVDASGQCGGDNAHESVYGYFAEGPTMSFSTSCSMTIPAALSVVSDNTSPLVLEQ